MERDPARGRLCSYSSTTSLKTNSAFSHAAMWWLIVTLIALSRMATLSPALGAGGMKLTTHRPRHLAQDGLLLLPQCSLQDPMTRSWPRVIGQFLVRLILPLKKHLYLPGRSLVGRNCSLLLLLWHLNSDLWPLSPSSWLCLTQETTLSWQPVNLLSQLWWKFLFAIQYVHIS